MRKLLCATVLVCLVLSPPARGAGLAHNKQFIVMAGNQQAADEFLKLSEASRKDLIKKWFNDVPPTGERRVLVHIQLTDRDDHGRTSLAVSPDDELHFVWVVTSREKAESTLRHELSHTLFAAFMPEGMPAWTNEGAASLEDDRERVRTRRSILDRFAQSGNWPNLSAVFDKKGISPADQTAYTVSSSVTEYLVERKDRATFLQFAHSGSKLGWNRALKQHYQIDGIDQLQTAWTAWASRNTYASRLDERSPRSEAR